MFVGRTLFLFTQPMQNKSGLVEAHYASSSPDTIYSLI